MIIIMMFMREEFKKGYKNWIWKYVHIKAFWYLKKSFINLFLEIKMLLNDYIGFRFFIKVSITFTFLRYVGIHILYLNQISWKWFETINIHLKKAFTTLSFVNYFYTSFEILNSFAKSREKKYLAYDFFEKYIFKAISSCCV